MSSQPRFGKRQLVAGLTRHLRGRCEHAFLFGSYARNAAYEHSDVDLIVVAPSKRPFVERFRDFFDVVLDYAPVDLIVYTPEEWRALKKAPNPLVARARKEWRALAV